MSEDDKFLPECLTCLEEYDEQERVPVVLNCGHSICKTCKTKVIRCPSCEKNLNGVGDRRNYALMGAKDSIIDLIQRQSENDARHQHEVSEKDEELRQIREKLDDQSQLINDLRRLLEETSNEVNYGKGVMQSQQEKLNEDDVVKQSLLTYKEEQMKRLQRPQLNCSECDVCQDTQNLFVCQTCILKKKGVNCSQLENNPKLGDIDIRWYTICSECAVNNHLIKDHSTMGFETVSTACKLQRQLFVTGKVDFVPATVMNNVFVKNLAASVDDKQLENIFKIYGTVLSSKVERNPDGRSKGFGFVCYEQEDDARKAIANMHNSLFKGKKLYVALQQKKEDRAKLNSIKAEQNKDQPGTSG